MNKQIPEPTDWGESHSATVLKLANVSEQLLKALGENAVYEQTLSTLLAALADEEIWHESTEKAIAKATEIVKGN